MEQIPQVNIKSRVKKYLAIAVIYTTVAVLASETKDKDKDKPDPALKCAGGYGNEYQLNMLNENLFCTEHAGRTCCNLNDTLKIKAKVGFAKVKSDVSDQCMAFTAKALCSHCDGDMGLGKLNGVCQSYCEQWYNVCQNEYFDPYVNQNENLPFCKKDSLICSAVNDVVDADPIKFCKMMGVKVQDELSESCFNGVSSSSRLGNLKRKIEPSQSSSTIETIGKNTLDLIKKYLLRAARLIVTNSYFERFVEFMCLVILLALVWFGYKWFCSKKSRKQPQRLNKALYEEIQRKRISKLDRNK
ncbi:UNKNOWN [Stylonychia lemnae]|uniref:Folate receptor-like domain-containing protein n=1 Tax=Stylonychia lemnae TaxID=5949 RepID=A0A078A8F8_STYLE|nr:UNKNOWN [Stylonychia lemnae]|eukprot:CDW77852.1 UNKNOWN [Stylonychia lemnae]